MNQLCSIFSGQRVLPSANNIIKSSNNQQRISAGLDEKYQVIAGKILLGGTTCSTGEGTGERHSSREHRTLLFLAGQWEKFSILSLSLSPSPFLSLSLLLGTYISLSPSITLSLSLSLSFFCFALGCFVGFFFLHFPSITIRVYVFHQLWTLLITVFLQLQCQVQSITGHIFKIFF